MEKIGSDNYFVDDKKNVHAARNLNMDNLKVIKAWDN